MKHKPALYSNFAKYYDVVYAKKDYEGEVKFILENVESSDRILELACGTGSHSKLFSNLTSADIVGVDLNPEMLEIARAKNPDVEFIEADFLEFNSEESFDLVTLLFTSINYCNDLGEVEVLFQKVFNNLTESGSFVFDLGLTGIKGRAGKDTFIDDAELGDITIARYSEWKPLNDERSQFQAKYLTLVKDLTGMVDFTLDKHILGAFSLEEICEALRKLGFKNIKIYDGYTDNEVPLDYKFTKIPVIVTVK